MNKNLIRNLVIGVLIPILIFLVWKGCNKPKPEPDTIEETSLPNWFTDDITLIPQEGNFACWAASLDMLGKVDDSLNNENTSPIHTDSLSAHLENFVTSDLSQMQDPDWEKVKAELYSKRPLVVYKYFNLTHAHVFVVRGYHQSEKYKWLLVNDPWPVKTAKIAALDLRNFTRPFNGNTAYEAMKYKPASASKEEYTESNFNIYSSNPLSGEKPTDYNPISRIIKKREDIDIQKFKSLLGELHEDFRKIDPDFYKSMNIDYEPQSEQLSIDFNRAILLNNFNDTAYFMNYDLAHSQKPDYLFNATLQVYTNFKKAGKPVITTTIDYENKTADKFLYVSRFEAYGKSVMADCDSILFDFIQAFKRPEILKLLQPNKSKAANSEFRITTEVEPEAMPEISDWSSLPVYGGPVYSFILEGFNEKIVADPYKQLKVKPGKKALFIGESGTPYYRLSSVELPQYGEIVKPVPGEKIPVEWPVTESKPIPDPVNPDDPNKPHDPINNEDPNKPDPKPPVILNPEEVLEKIFNEKPALQVSGIIPAFDGKSITLRPSAEWMVNNESASLISNTRLALEKRASLYYKSDLPGLKKFKNYLIKGIDIRVITPEVRVSDEKKLRRVTPGVLRKEN